MSTVLRGESGELQAVVPVSPERFRCVVIATRWNTEITDALTEGAVSTLRAAGVPDARITVLRVPGAVELTHGARFAAQRYAPDAIIVLGCVIRGDTPHFDYVCQSVTQGVTMLNATGDVPVIFGVLTVNDRMQALRRSGGDLGNKGAEAAVAAIEMANLKAMAPA